MKIKVLESSSGEHHSAQFMASYLVNDTVAIDAGCIGLLTPVAAQKQIQHIFLSHTHIDHIASLPIFVDNVYEPGPDCVKVYGSEPVLECLREDVFNDRLWPDMVRLSQEESPFLELIPIASGQAIEVDDVRVTPVSISHVVPTMGFLIEDDGAAVAMISDTGPTDDIWNLANGNGKLQAVFLEASFPNSMGWLAEKAKHLTPAGFLEQVGRLDKDVTVIAVHIKPSFETEIVAELQSLGLPDLQIGRPGTQYVFE